MRRDTTDHDGKPRHMPEEVQPLRSGGQCEAHAGMQVAALAARRASRSIRCAERMTLKVVLRDVFHHVLHPK